MDTDRWNNRVKGGEIIKVMGVCGARYCAARLRGHSRVVLHSAPFVRARFAFAAETTNKRNFLSFSPKSNFEEI